MLAIRSTAWLLMGAFALLGGANAAEAQTVDRVGSELVLGSSDGPPTCVIDADGVLHVVYSRNDKNSQETRADVYYVQVDLTVENPVPSREVCLTQGRGTWIPNNLGECSPLKTTKNTSFHMTPRVAVDSAGRVHVLFLGYGDLREGWYSTVSVRYNTQLAYLNFEPSDVLAWDGSGQCPLDACKIIVKNEEDTALDEYQAAGPDGGYCGLEYCRLSPNLTLEEFTDDDGAARVRVHAGFASASEYSETREMPAYFRISYARFDVDTTGSLVTGSTRKCHLDSGADNTPLAWSYIIAARPTVCAFPLPGGGVQALAFFRKEYDSVTEEDRCWGHYVFDPDATTLSVSAQEGPWADWSSLISPCIGLDSSGRLRAAGGTSGGAELVFPAQSLTSQVGPSTVSGSFDTEGNHGRGGTVVGSTLYRLGRDVVLEFLESSSSGDPVFYRYSVATADVDGANCDLDSAMVGSERRMAAVYAAGIYGFQLNDDTYSGTGNLKLTVFREPDPDDDLVAWITSPENGATVYLPKRVKGEMLLRAADGAPGTEESYTWKEGGKVLGTGQQLTTSFSDGRHTVTLIVSANGGSATASVTFTVESYTGNTPPAPPPPPTPGVTVSPTSGLTTTDTGGKATFTVVLDSQPVSMVTIPITSSNPSAGIAAPAMLTFSSTNWDQPVTVTVTGQEDAVTTDVAYTVKVGPAASEDPNYNGLDPDDVSLTNLDSSTPTTTTKFTSGDVDVGLPDRATYVSPNPVAALGTVKSLSLTLAITHSRPSDLTVTLISPAGIRHAVSSLSGTFAITAFSGEALTGLPWKLEIKDGKNRYTGTLQGWSLTITY